MIQSVIGTVSNVNGRRKGVQRENLIELKPGTQWVQVDLGVTCEIHALIIWHWYIGGRVYFDVVVQMAANNDFTKNVEEVYNNDHDNTSSLGVGHDKQYEATSEGRLIDCKGKVGRYVRCYSNGNTSNEANYYAEIEVWGIPVASK